VGSEGLKGAPSIPIKGLTSLQLDLTKNDGVSAFKSQIEPMVGRQSNASNKLLYLGKNSSELTEKKEGKSRDQNNVNLKPTNIADLY